MKNIHVLPTDKPSRLFYSGNSSKLTLNKYSVLFRVSPQNIYITSDEEIKEGDWYVSIDENIRRATSVWDTLYGKCPNEKIILTTDQDLIKDGVQPIDDEFLEWFVKNPSCEEVEINKIYNDYGETDIFDLVCTSHSFKYKIIIPKEETKNICIQTGLPCGMQCLSEDTCNRTKSKQKTLEEIKPKDIQRIISSTDAQTASIEIVELFSKWQQERSYSEEEVIQLVSDWTDYRMSEDTKSKVTFKKWFEKFKK